MRRRRCARRQPPCDPVSSGATSRYMWLCARGWRVEMRQKLTLCTAVLPAAIYAPQLYHNILAWAPWMVREAVEALACRSVLPRLLLPNLEVANIGSEGLQRCEQVRRCRATNMKMPSCSPAARPSPRADDPDPGGAPSALARGHKRATFPGAAGAISARVADQVRLCRRPKLFDRHVRPPPSRSPCKARRANQPP